MKFSLSILSISAATALVSASVPVANEYATLGKLCKDGGANVYVGVQFRGGETTTFSFDQCYPYTLNGKPAQMAVFCKSATCYSNPKPDCTGGAVPPVPVIIPAGLTLINAAQWVQYLGQGATCQPNGLSHL